MEFVYNLLKFIGLIIIITQFNAISDQISHRKEEFHGLDDCFIFFNEAMIAGLCLQIPTIIDIQKLSRSIDTMVKLIELLFNEEKDINKFAKLKNIMNIIRILIFQMISLFVCTCVSSVLCHHTRDPICV